MKHSIIKYKATIIAVHQEQEKRLGSLIGDANKIIKYLRSIGIRKKYHGIHISSAQTCRKFPITTYKLRTYKHKIRLSETGALTLQSLKGKHNVKYHILIERMQPVLVFTKCRKQFREDFNDNKTKVDPEYVFNSYTDTFDGEMFNPEHRAKRRSKQTVKRIENEGLIKEIRL